MGRFIDRQKHLPCTVMETCKYNILGTKSCGPRDIIYYKIYTNFPSLIKWVSKERLTCIAI